MALEEDQPVFVTVVALGILVVLAAWAVEVLGFGELGPIESIVLVVRLESYAILSKFHVGNFSP